MSRKFRVCKAIPGKALPPYVSRFREEKRRSGEYSEAYVAPLKFAHRAGDGKFVIYHKKSDLESLISSFS